MPERFASARLIYSGHQDEKEFKQGYYAVLVVSKRTSAKSFGPIMCLMQLLSPQAPV